MSKRTAQVIIEFNAKMDKLNKQTDELSSRMENISAVSKRAGAVLAGVGAAGIAIMKSWTDEARTNEEMNARLAATLKSTGQAAGLTYDEMKKLSGELQNSTGYAQANIDEMNALLLTFTNINKDVFPETAKLTADINRQLGKDGGGLTSTAQMVGKALNDPIQGLTALRRVGIQFSDEQEDMIRNFVAMNDVASAQEIILGELNTQFGATSEKYMGTLNGKIDMMTNKWNDLKAQLGEKLIPVLMNLIDKYLIPLIDWISNLDDGTIELIAKITMLTTAFSLIAAPILLIIGFIPQIIAGFKSIAFLTSALTGGISALTAKLVFLVKIPIIATFNAIKLMVTSLSGSVGILTAKFVALVAVFKTAYEFGKLLSDIPFISSAIDAVVTPIANMGLQSVEANPEAIARTGFNPEANARTSVVFNNPIFDREEKLNKFQKIMNNNQAPATI